MASHSLSYDCPACHATSPVVITDLPDPSAHLTPRTQATLRQVQAIKEPYGQANEGDPVESLRIEILESTARSTLRYAVCPRCGARNPEGLAAQAREQQRTRYIGTLVSVGVAGLVWFIPVLAYLVAALAALQTVAMALLARRRSGPFPWLAFAVNLGMTTGFMTVAALFPRAAALMPLVLAVRFLIDRRGGEGSWRTAAESIRFQE